MPRSLNSIRSLRLRKPWKQSDLAMRSGCTQSDISAYERGDVVPELAKALDIAVALGRRIEDVFFGHFEAACARVGGRLQSSFLTEPETQ